MTSPATSSDLLTSSAVIMAYPGRLMGCSLTAGSDTATLIIYDKASAASGKVLDKLAVAAGATININYNYGIVANNGIYASLSGTGPGFVVHYSRG